MIQDHQPSVIDKFNGLYGTDSFNDSVPGGYFVDELNTITEGDEVRTRDGFASSHTIAGSPRFYIYRRQGEASRILYLTNAGALIDLTTGGTILNIPAMTDVAIQVVNNRAYISPHNGISGLPGEFVYVYTGTGSARKAAGNKPAGSFTVSVSATAGTIDEGTHIFAWVYETTTGFVTPPSPAQIISVDGTKAVDFSNIPVGPVGTAKRRLIASRAISDYNGNEFGYEMFFVPNGTIEDNTTTILAALDFFDEELVDTADYTYDQLEEIPAVVFMAPYGKRVAYGGPDEDKSLVYFSHADEPEGVSSIAGFLSFDPFETEGVKDATEFRDNFYVTKANHTYTLRDNGFDPSTWKPLRLDQAIGANVNGIAQYLDSKGARVEFWIGADESGLYKFQGVYEEIPLTKNIQKFWKRISRGYFNKVQVLIDQKRLRIYVLVPLDGAISPNYMFVGNFENGFQVDRIKWHLWEFGALVPASIAIDIDNTTKKTILKFSSLSGNIYGQEENRRNDAGAAINNFIQFGLVGSGSNSIHHCGGVGLRVTGSGSLQLRLLGQDDIDFQNLGTLSLASAGGREHFRQATFMSERVSLLLSINAVNSYFKLRKAVLYINQIFATRPNA